MQYESSTEACFLELFVVFIKLIFRLHYWTSVDLLGHWYSTKRGRLLSTDIWILQIQL